MVAPNIRGNWTVDEAINMRWDDADLDSAIRNEWPAASKLSTKYQPLNDQEARPVPPGPYVVYEIMSPFVVGHMTGAEGTQEENQFQRMLVQFTVHASSTATESGKARAIRIAKLIAEAFDPETFPWTMYDDAHVSVTREADFGVREDDDEWAWALQYNVMIDARYSQV
jgi:hypothetical protein